MGIKERATLLTMAVLLPTLGNAQVYQIRTPPPPATAQYEGWQFSDEPILVGGLIYCPTRETRFFDGQIMTQIGVYRRVPVYADVTLEPNSVVYVPVGRQQMRGYERRREGELAGTTGSRVPAFPVDVASPLTVTPRELTAAELAAVGTAGGRTPAPERDSARAPAPPLGSGAAPNIPRRERTRIESIPHPTRNDGIWVEYAGSRWYSDGPAAAFDEHRFVQIGIYRGFPVYRDQARSAEEIWVRVVPDGPVAPYVKR